MDMIQYSAWKVKYISEKEQNLDKTKIFVKTDPYSALLGYTT